MSALSLRQLFLQHVAQTSHSPVLLEIASAKGNYLFDADGKPYLDLIGGISVCALGHGHADVLQAIHRQAEKHLHVMVYGELEQAPQTLYAQALVADLPPTLDSVYFTNSGSEAIEGAMKLAKRITGRTQFVAQTLAYHGSTQGALSLMSDSYFSEKFKPLLPNIHFIEQNCQEDLHKITEATAAVFAETTQAEKGCVVSKGEYLQALAARCAEVGALLVLDENQTGLGRTGTLWSFEQYGIVPDILVAGKALGGGLPLGAFISSRQRMLQLAENPVLGHITTFGGHPLSCAAGLAAYQVISKDLPTFQIAEKEKLCREIFSANPFVQVSGAGQLLALLLAQNVDIYQIIQLLLAQGIFTDWFLFAPQAIRLAPPLNMDLDTYHKGLNRMNDTLTNFFKK